MDLPTKSCIEGIAKRGEGEACPPHSRENHCYGGFLEQGTPQNGWFMTIHG